MSKPLAQAYFLRLQHAWHLLCRAPAVGRSRRELANVFSSPALWFKAWPDTKSHRGFKNFFKCLLNPTPDLKPIFQGGAQESVVLKSSPGQVWKQLWGVTDIKPQSLQAGTESHAAFARKRAVGDGMEEVVASLS